MHKDKYRFTKLNLQKNLFSDDGIKLIMHEVRRSKSIVEINLASNEISNEGMIYIFKNLVDN